MTRQAIDAINMVNLLIGVVSFCLLFARTSLRRREYPKEVILLFVALLGTTAALLFTSLELLLFASRENPPPVVHLILLSVLILSVKIGLLWILWSTRHALYRTAERHAGNGDEVDVNRNISDFPDADYGTGVEN